MKLITDLNNNTWSKKLEELENRYETEKENLFISYVLGVQDKLNVEIDVEVWRIENEYSDTYKLHTVILYIEDTTDTSNNSKDCLSHKTYFKVTKNLNDIPENYENCSLFFQMTTASKVLCIYVYDAEDVTLKDVVKVYLDNHGEEIIKFVLFCYEYPDLFYKYENYKSLPENITINVKYK